MSRAPYMPQIRRLFVDVETLQVLEQYLGDRPQSDKRAADLHDRIVTLLDAQGLLKGDAG
jgi:hypothetical protein